MQAQFQYALRRRPRGGSQSNSRRHGGLSSVSSGSATGTPGQAGSRPTRTPAQKSHNPRSDRRIAPRCFLELPESVSLIGAMESLQKPPDLSILTSSPRSHGPFTLLPCPLLLSGESPRSSSRRAGDVVRERKGEEMKGRGAADKK